MDLDDLDIYDDLEEFHEEEQKKSNELLALEEKCKEHLQTIENVKLEKKELKKKLKVMEVNFQSLLDTAKAEIQRKDKQILQLRKEKDDICFRRKKPVGGHEVYTAEEQEQFGTTTNTNPFKQKAHTIPAETIVAEPEDTECLAAELPAGLPPPEKPIELVQYPTNHIYERKSRVPNPSGDYHKADNKSRTLSRDHESDYRSKRESSNHRHHENVSRSAKRPHSRERCEDLKRDTRGREAFKRSDFKSNSQHEHRERGNPTHWDKNKRESSRDKKESFRNRHSHDKTEKEQSRSKKSSSKEKICPNEKEKKKIINEDKPNVKVHLEKKQTPSIDNECETQITKPDHNESKETPFKLALNKTEVADSKNAQKKQVIIKNTHHEANTPTKVCKTPKKSERVDENSNLATTEPILKTPSKVALFDALFGSTPSSVDSSSSLLTNVRQILNSGGNESTTTTPSGYTSASEISEKHYKTENGKEKTEQCEHVTAKVVEKYITANNKDKITDESGQVVDEINTKKIVEEVAEEVSKELPTKPIQKPEELAVTTSTLFGPTNAACIPALGDLADCDVVKAGNKNKPIVKLKVALKPPEKNGFWIRKNEIIEIEDDTDVDEDEDEKTANVKVENLAHDIEKKQSILELVSSDEEHFEKKPLKNKIEIIENIRLPTLFNVQANVKTSTTKALETSALADENKLTCEETSLGVITEKVAEASQLEPLTNDTEKLQAKSHPPSESKDKGDKEIVTFDTIDITEDTSDSQYLTNIVGNSESIENVSAKTNAVLASNEANQEDGAVLNTKPSSDQDEKPLDANSIEQIESASSCTGDNQSEAEVVIEVAEEEKEKEEKDEEEKSIEMTQNSKASHIENIIGEPNSNLSEKPFDTESNIVAEEIIEKAVTIDDKLVVDSFESIANESQENKEAVEALDGAFVSTESIDKVQLQANENVEENEKKEVNETLSVEVEAEAVAQEVLSEIETQAATEELVPTKVTENCLQENQSIPCNPTDNMNVNENPLNPSPKPVEIDQRKILPGSDENSTGDCLVEVIHKSETSKNPTILAAENSSINKTTTPTVDKTESLDEAATLTVRIAIHQLSALKSNSRCKYTNEIPAEPSLEDGVSFIVNNISCYGRIEKELGNECDISKDLPRKRKLSMDEETVHQNESQKLAKIATVNDLVRVIAPQQLEECERESQKSIKVTTVEELMKVNTPPQLEESESNSNKCVPKSKKPSSHLKSPSEEDDKLKLKKEAAETLLQLQIVKEQATDQNSHTVKNEKTKAKLYDKDVNQKSTINSSERPSLKVSANPRRVSKASKNICNITMAKFTKDSKKLKKSPCENITKALKVTTTQCRILEATDHHQSTKNHKLSMKTMAANCKNKHGSSKIQRVTKPKPKLTQRRILDTTSEEEDVQPDKFKPTTNCGSMANSTPIRLNKHKGKPTLEEDSAADDINVQANILDHNSSDQNLIPIPLISPSLHAIFQTEAHMNDAAAITGMLPSMPGNSSRDAQFNEIDSRLESMFQSPPYALELPYKSDFNAPDILLGIDANATIDETTANSSNFDAVDMNTTNAASTNVTIAETTENSSTFDQSLLNETDNSSMTKHISLGSSDYRFEKISDNVVNLFITRKRRKKRKVVVEQLVT